ncbi:hypothetical protein PanWU01x14_330320 [Parasponia andersonii]|uniref:Uncharacterized protein n=1 Tax=Parasponia andersonii TaxID=3476 RepID=A0A2P5AI36_PARAD|nr:hypothetical protein PanWU01x14_330320 [Parasponia andersonii]
MNDNTYKLELPGEYGISVSFNVADLSPFDASDDLRINPFQEGENDANVADQLHVQEEEHSRGLGRTQGQHSRDPLSLPNEPITRLRAKRFKKALNGLIQYIGEMTNTWRPDISPNQIQGNLITMIKVLKESN